MRISYHRRQFETSTLLMVQQRGEYSRRIKLGKAHEINRAIYAHERDGAQVAYDAVILDWLVSSALN